MRRLKHSVTICVVKMRNCEIILQNFVKTKDIEQDYDYSDVHIKADYSQ